MSDKLPVFELLNKRSEFEMIVRKYKLPGERKHGTIENLKWFLKNGHKANRFRPNFKHAQNLAQTILDNK